MTHFSVTFSSGTILTLTHLGDKAWTTKQSQWCRQIWFPQVPWQVQGRQHPQRESLSHVFCIGWGWYTWSVILLTRTSLLPLHRAHSGHSTVIWWFQLADNSQQKNSEKFLSMASKLTATVRHLKDRITVFSRNSTPFLSFRYKYLKYQVP